MNKIDKIDFKKIQRISPSQFNSMRNCAYKSLLAEALNRKSLLPLSANAYYGTVLHKMLELISIGYIKSETEFTKTFQEQVKIMEDRLIADGYSHFVPLQKKVRNFTEKVILLKDHLSNSFDKPARNNGIKFSSEKWFESKDKMVGGKVDMVIEMEGMVEILDFKTGAITEDIFDDTGELFQDVKAEYKDQLKLYAYLYFDNNGTFPSKLSLVDLANQKFNIEFSELECKTLFDEAKKKLIEVNGSVDSKVFKANPNEANCKFCLYRPSCEFYLEYLKTNHSFNDVCGTIISAIQYQNGNVTVFLLKEDQKVSVAGFGAENFDYFNMNRNKKIGCFNLKKETTDYFYSTTKTTMIYEQSDTI